MGEDHGPGHASLTSSTRSVERWGWYSMLVNVVLIAVNGFVAHASGSLAVGAELLHNGVDLLTALAVLVGLKLATRKSVRFPYGLYKLENLVAVGLAVMTFITGYEIARKAINGVLSLPVVTPASLGGIVIAWIVPLVFSHFELRVGRAANSPALIADAKEYRAHVFTTGAAFAALVGSWAGISIDRIAALVVVVAIAKTGWELLLDGMRVLLDASLDAETLLKIRSIIVSDPAVVSVNWVTGRNAGRFRFVEAEVVLRVKALAQADAVVRRLSATIRREVPYIERVLIHASPKEQTHLRCAIPLSDRAGTVSPVFGEAPYFALVAVRLADQALDMQQVLPNPYRAVDRAKGIRVAEWLVAQKVDRVLVAEGETLEGKGPVYVFGEAGVEILATSAATLSEALQECMR